MSSNVLKGLAVDGWKIYRPPLENEGGGCDLPSCTGSAADSCLLSSEEGKAHEDVRRQGLREEGEKERLQLLEDARRQGEIIKETAQREGYESGVRQGEAERKALREEGELLLQEARRERSSIIKSAEAEILQIAVSISEKLLHCKIILDKNTVLAVLKKALETLPEGQNVILSLNPQDEAVCRESLFQLQEHLRKGSSLKIVGSAAISRGSCKVDSEEAEIAINLQTELELLASKLLALAGE